MTGFASWWTLVTSLNIHVGGTVINNFVGFICEDDGFLLHRSLSMEFERTNPLACTVRKI